MVTGHQGDAGVLHDRFGVALRSHGADRVGRRSDEDGAGGGNRFGEVRIFRKEAVARMHRVGAAAANDVGQPVDDQVTRLRWRGADMVGGVREGNMPGLRVGIGVDGDGPNSEPPRGLDDAAGDFAPVGDEQRINMAWFLNYAGIAS